MIVGKFLRNIKAQLSIIGEKFSRLWFNYIYQSFFAAVVIFTLLMVLNMQRLVVVASMGATSFIVFAMPKSITSEPRRIIGGHLIGLATGALTAVFLPHTSMVISVIAYSAAVAGAMFLMVALDAEHPPAGGTALGIAISGWSLKIMLVIIISVIVLSAAHVLLKKYMKDLV